MGSKVKYKKAQFLMKLRLISKNVFIKLDGRRIHHIRTSARSGCRMDQEPESDRYGLLGLQTGGQDTRPFSR